MSDTTTAELAIEATGLTKRYGSLEAVKGIDLTVPTGSIFGFLGPNGAGKTTTIEILEGYRTRDGGSVSVLGHDPATAPRSWREDIGIVLQESEIDPVLTAAEAVRLYAAYYERPRAVGEVLELVGLSDAADHRAAKLSGGQKRRLDVALALVGNPKLVFLDEPTTGFDPSARRDSWSMIENLRTIGTTVLLTTHYMDEAQHLADDIAVISAGTIVASGTAQQLAEQIAARPRITWRGGANPPDRLGANRDGDTFVIETDHAPEVVYELTSWARDAGEPLADLEVRRPSLEDVYLSLVDAEPSGPAGPEPAPASRRRGRRNRR